MSAALLIAALLLDGVMGEPKWLWARVPHPAVLMGRLIGWCDTRFNDGTRARGALVLAALVLAAGLAGWLIAALPLGWLWSMLLAAMKQPSPRFTTPVPMLLSASSAIFVELCSPLGRVVCPGSG